MHQLVDRPTDVINRLLHRASYLLVKAIDIDRQFYMPIGQTIGRYRSKNSRTYWSQLLSIDNLTCLLVTVICIDRQCDILIVGQYPIVPIYQNKLVEVIGIDRRIHTPILRTILYRTNISGPICPSNRY